MAWPCLAGRSRYRRWLWLGGGQLLAGPVSVQGQAAHVVAKSPVGHGDSAFAFQMAVNLGVLPAFLKKFLDCLQASYKLNSRHVIGEAFPIRGHGRFLVLCHRQGYSRKVDHLENILKYHLFFL